MSVVVSPKTTPDAKEGVEGSAAKENPPELVVVVVAAAEVLDVTALPPKMDAAKFDAVEGVLPKLLPNAEKEDFIPGDAAEALVPYLIEGVVVVTAVVVVDDKLLLPKGNTIEGVVIDVVTEEDPKAKGVGAVVVVVALIGFPKEKEGVAVVVTAELLFPKANDDAVVVTSSEELFFEEMTGNPKLKFPPATLEEEPKVGIVVVVVAPAEPADNPLSGTTTDETPNLNGVAVGLETTSTTEGFFSVSKTSFLFN